MIQPNGSQSTRFNTLALCAAVAAALSLASCSTRAKSIKVSMPATGSGSAAQVSPGGSSAMSVAAPAAFNGFSCFALNVRGPGIAPDGPICHGNPAVGKISDFAPINGGSVEVKVVPGPQRTIQLIGVMTGDGSCPNYEQLKHLPPGFSISTFDLGQKTVDVFSDVNVTMRAQYDPGNPVETLQGCGEGGGGMGPPPTAFPSLAAWYSAQAVTGGYADNALIPNLDDLSGNALDATATGSEQPTLIYGAQNGQAALDFNGSINQLHLPASSTFDSPGAGYTVISVASFEAGSNSRPLLRLNFSDSTSMTGAAYLGVELNPSGYFLGLGWIMGTVVSIGDSVNQVGAGFKVYATKIRADGSGIESFVNGLQTGYQAGADQGYSGMTAGTIGYASSYAFDGKLGELIIYNRELAPAEFQSLHCSLAAIYALPMPPFCGP